MIKTNQKRKPRNYSSAIIYDYSSYDEDINIYYYEILLRRFTDKENKGDDIAE
tara:strand:- start:4141 stop:4299 length:159 start_codon:yes stop_codon:yes gene_type:complete